MTTPMWWNHTKNVVPARRVNKALCKAVAKYPSKADAVLWPLQTKPQQYFW